MRREASLRTELEVVKLGKRYCLTRRKDKRKECFVVYLDAKTFRLIDGRKLGNLRAIERSISFSAHDRHKIEYRLGMLSMNVKKPMDIGSIRLASGNMH